MNCSPQENLPLDSGSERSSTADPRSASLYVATEVERVEGDGSGEGRRRQKCRRREEIEVQTVEGVEVQTA